MKSKPTVKEITRDTTISLIENIRTQTPNRIANGFSEMVCNDQKYYKETGLVWFI